MFILYFSLVFELCITNNKDLSSSMDSKKGTFALWLMQDKSEYCWE